MVDKKQKNNEIGIDRDDTEITSEEVRNDDIDLVEIEKEEEKKIKTLRDSLKICDTEKKKILEESLRVKADFFNAKRRLEDERIRDRELAKIDFIEKLLPLCDSFFMATSNEEVWNKVDESWRKGVEGIYTQLQGVLTLYAVKSINPLGQIFDHNKHEALSTVPVKDKDAQDKIITVIQMGYEMTGNNGDMILIRPARVIIGSLED